MFVHEYLERLKSYAYHIETCGEERNSYSKTDHDVAVPGTAGSISGETKGIYEKTVYAWR